MSGARQVPRAAVLAGHGDRGGGAPNQTLLNLAAALRDTALSDLASLDCVTAGVLKGEPSLEEALAAAAASSAGEILVYPLFMAEGYFTAQVLPTRVRETGLEARCRLLSPLGLDAAVPELMGRDAAAAAREAGLVARSARLLVAGHGSKFGPASAEATRAAAARIAETDTFASVAVAFLEEAPFLADELAGGRPPTIVSGFFFGDGLHAGEDVPAAIRASGSRAIYAGSAGTSPGLARVIAAALAA